MKSQSKNEAPLPPKVYGLDEALDMLQRFSSFNIDDEKASDLPIEDFKLAEAAQRALAHISDVQRIDAHVQAALDTIVTETRGLNEEQRNRVDGAMIWLATNHLARTNHLLALGLVLKKRRETLLPPALVAMPPGILSIPAVRTVNQLREILEKDGHVRFPDEMKSLDTEKILQYLEKHYDCVERLKSFIGIYAGEDVATLDPKRNIRLLVKHDGRLALIYTKKNRSHLGLEFELTEGGAVAFYKRIEAR